MNPLALEDRLLAIQRQMICKLIDQNLREQPCGGQALVDDVGRHRFLSHRLATWAGPHATDMTLNAKGTRCVVQLLADLFTNALELAAAGAPSRVGLMPVLHTGQLRGQRFTFWPIKRGSRCLEGLELLPVVVKLVVA